MKLLPVEDEVRMADALRELLKQEEAMPLLGSKMAAMV